jgi:phosphoribosylformylglycinamidine cyclo-ligase
VARQDEYRRSGVDYEVLDEVKRQAIALAAATAPLLAASGAAEFPESRGSSAYVFEVQGSTLALVVEGLGTKSIIAAEYLTATGVSRYADIARDAVAAIVNDVISVGANALVVTAYFAAGDAAWYGNRESLGRRRVAGATRHCHAGRHRAGWKRPRLGACRTISSIRLRYRRWRQDRATAQ